jgi:uncharacterized protein YcfJ
MIALSIGVAILILGAASASALITRNVVSHEDAPAVAAATPSTAKAVHHAAAGNQTIRWNNPRQPAPQQAQTACNDGNIVGYVAGALAGGLAGSQLGKGNGKIATTMAGTAGGAYLGGQYLPTQNVTCR